MKDTNILTARQNRGEGKYKLYVQSSGKSVADPVGFDEVCSNPPFLV